LKVERGSPKTGAAWSDEGEERVRRRTRVLCLLQYSAFAERALTRSQTQTRDTVWGGPASYQAGEKVDLYFIQLFEYTLKDLEQRQTGVTRSLQCQAEILNSPYIGS